MTRAKQKLQLMAEQNVLRAHDLLRDRAHHLKRLTIARGYDRSVGNLGITLQGRYQDDEFVDLIRPHVCKVILNQIHEIDRQLRELGVEPAPVPQPPTPEKPAAMYADDGGI